ncbi:MAG: PAS domain-containing protein [Sulfuricaulis sp.]|nr:PAS domain-containing protein [Sulfuricaulis sp.]
MIDPVWTIYFDGRPLEVNRAFGGYTLEEWRYGGKAFYQQVYTPESYQRLREFTRQMRTTRRPQHNVEVALRAKDGSRFYIPRAHLRSVPARRFKDRGYRCGARYRAPCD